MRLMKDRRGEAGPGMIMFIIVFILVVSVVMEISRVHTIRSHVEKELSRAANLSVEIAMLDDYRQDGISKIDVAAAQAALSDYIHGNMNLDASYALRLDGKTEYRLIINSLTFEEEPPKIRIEGTIVIPVSVLHEYLDEGVSFRIHLKIATRNQRLDA